MWAEALRDADISQQTIGKLLGIHPRRAWQFMCGWIYTPARHLDALKLYAMKMGVTPSAELLAQYQLPADYVGEIERASKERAA